MDGQRVEATISAFVPKLDGEVPDSVLDPRVRFTRSAANLTENMAFRGYSFVCSNFEGPVYTAERGHNMRLRVTAPCITPPRVVGPHAKRLAFQKEPRCVIPPLLDEAQGFFGAGTVITVTQRCRGCMFPLESISAAVENPRKGKIVIGRAE